jgi:biotin carboxylase
VSRLLVVGASHAEIPLIRAGQGLGHWVSTVGSDAEALGAKASDSHFKVDFSDADAVLRVFDEGKFHGVVSGCNDFAAFTAARVSEARGLANCDSNETTRLIHHKDAFRKVASELKLNSPDHFVVSSVTEANKISQQIKFPAIVKPTDLTGGKGVSVVQDPSALGTAVEAALSRSRMKNVVVESFVAGSLRSALYIVLGGITHLVVSADEFMYLNPFLVTGAVSTIGEAPETRLGLAEQIRLVVSALALTDGLMHVQYIWSGSDFTILEVCRRPPGDLYLLLAEFASGYNISDALVRLALGELVDSPENFDSSRSVFRLCLMPPRSGELRDWQIQPKLLQHVEFRLDLLPQQTVISDHLTQKLGIVLGFGNSRNGLINLVCSPERHLDVTFKDPS